MNPSFIKKTSAIWALILLGLFLMFENWLPTKEALVLTIGIPFLYFIPGFLVTKVGFSSADRLETIILAMLFSMMLSHMGIYTLEEASRRAITIADIALTVAAINVILAVAYLVRGRRLSPARLLARLRGKLHKRNQKQP